MLIDMERKKSELLQTLMFTVICLGNLFLASRYYSREDWVGMAIFAVVVVLSAVAVFGHFAAWRGAR
jgi:hypothetical protein